MPDITKLSIDGKVYKFSGLNVNDSNAVAQTVGAIRNSPTHQQYMKDNSFIGLQTKRFQNEGYDAGTANLAAIDSRSMRGDAVTNRANLRTNTTAQTKELKEATESPFGAGRLALHAPFDVLDRAIYNAGSKLRSGNDSRTYDEAGGVGNTFADKLVSDQDVKDLADHGNLIAKLDSGIRSTPVVGSVYKGLSSPAGAITLGLTPALRAGGLALEGVGAASEAANALALTGEAGEAANATSTATQVGKGLSTGASALDTIGKGFVPAQALATSPDLLTDPSKYLEENALGLALHGAGALSKRLSVTRTAGGVPSEGVSAPEAPQVPENGIQVPENGIQVPENGIQVPTDVVSSGDPATSTANTLTPQVETQPIAAGIPVHTLTPEDVTAVNAINELDPTTRIQPNPNLKALYNEFVAKVKNTFSSKASFINSITPQGFQEFIKIKTARIKAGIVMNDAYDNFTSGLSEDHTRRLGIYAAADRQLAIKNDLLGKQLELDRSNLLLDRETGEPLVNDKGIEARHTTTDAIQGNQQKIVNREISYQQKLAKIALEREGSPLVDPVTGKPIKATGVSVEGEAPTLEEYFNDPDIQQAIEKWNGKGLPELRQAYADAGFDAEGQGSHGYYSDTYFPSEALDAEGYRQPGSPLATSANGKYFGTTTGSNKFKGTGATYNDDLREILVNRHAGALSEAAKRNFIANLQNTDYGIHSDDFDKAIESGRLAYDLDPVTKQKTLFIKTANGYEKAVRIPLDNYVHQATDPVQYKPSGTVPYPDEVNVDDVLPNKAVYKTEGQTKTVYDNFNKENLREPLKNFRIPEETDVSPEYALNQPNGPRGGKRPLNFPADVPPDSKTSAQTPDLTKFGNQKTKNILVPKGPEEYQVPIEKGSGKQFGLEEDPDRSINGALNTNEQPDPFGRTRPSNIPVDQPLYDVNADARAEYKLQAKARINAEAGRLRTAGLSAREAIKQAIDTENQHVDSSILSTEHPPNLQPIPELPDQKPAPSLYTTGAIGNEFKNITESENPTILGNIFDKVSGNVIVNYLSGIGEFVNHGSTLVGRTTSALNNDIAHAGVNPLIENQGVNIASQLLRGLKRGSLISTIQTLSDIRTSLDKITPDQKLEALSIAAEMGYLPDKVAGVETKSPVGGPLGKVYEKTSDALYGDKGLVVRGLASIYKTVDTLYPSEPGDVGLSPDANNAYRIAIQRFNRNVTEFKPAAQRALNKVGLGTFYGTGAASLKSAYNVPIVQAFGALATHAIVTTLAQKLLDNKHRWANEVGAKIGEFYFQGPDGQTYKYSLPNLDSELNKPIAILNSALQGVYKQADIDHVLKDVGVAGLNQVTSPITGGPISGAISGYTGVAPAFRVNDSLDGVQPFALPQSKTGLLSADRLIGAVRGALPLSSAITGSNEDRQLDNSGSPNQYTGLNHLLPVLGQRDIRPLIDIDKLRDISSKQQDRRDRKNNPDG